MWKCAFHLSVMKIWASGWKLNQVANEEMRYRARDRCTMQKQNDHDRWTYLEASSKWQQSEMTCQAKKEKKMKALGGKHDKLIEWKHNPRWQDKGDLTDTQTQPISEHSQLETKKREYWIRTVTKEAPKALRCTHVWGRKSYSKDLRLNLRGQVALNGYGWTLKNP